MLFKCKNKKLEGFLSKWNKDFQLFIANISLLCYRTGYISSVFTNFDFLTSAVYICKLLDSWIMEIFTQGVQIQLVLLYSRVYLVLAVHQNHSQGECPSGWGLRPGEEPCSDVCKERFSHWTASLDLSEIIWWFQTGRLRSWSSRCFHSLSWWWSLLSFAWQGSQLSVTQLAECRSAVSLF